MTAAENVLNVQVAEAAALTLFFSCAFGSNPVKSKLLLLQLIIVG